ncbi:S1C family serine protease [Pelagicoccus mobilis]
MKCIGILATVMLGLALTVDGLGRDLSGLFEEVKGQVVTIYTNKSNADSLGSEGEQGTGVIISAEGKVITAAHVVHSADVVIVEYVDGRRVRAEVLTTAPWADVAALQLTERPPPEYVATLGVSQEMKIGEELFVVGTPLGLGHSLSFGHLSGRRKNSEDFMVKAELLQTDASINPGNSGGPMYNMEGEVVGVVSHILSNSGGFEGVGFAVSIDVAKELLLERSAFWSGMEYKVLYGEAPKVLNIDRDFAFIVESVARGSFGERLGLKGGRIPVSINGTEFMGGGDVLLSVQGVPIDSVEQALKLRGIVRDVNPDEVLKVVVMRKGKLIELEAPRSLK